MSAQAFVAVLMGSDSDWPAMRACVETLKSYGISCETRISSAHRTPEATQSYVKEAEKRGCQVFIAAAGMAAHLAGAVAANTCKPVIGVPMEASLDGLDALLSTVQMPPGVPVASVAIGKAGAKNAAFLAAQILALYNPELSDKLQHARAEARDTIEQKNCDLQRELEQI